MSKATREKRRQEQANGIVPVTAVPPVPLLRLDFGSGPNVREGFEGVDRLPFGGKVKHVVDLAARDPWGMKKRADSPLPFKPWPWPDASVEEAHSSHFVEHLDRFERVHFFNELYRVLAPGGKATIICPNWSSSRAYGDPTHQWPPMGVFWFFYLTRQWRVGVDAECQRCRGAGHPYDAQGHVIPAPCRDCGGKGRIFVPGNAPHTDAEHDPQGYTCDFDWMAVYGVNPEITVRSEDWQRFALSHYIESAHDIHATLTKTPRA